MTPQEYLEFLAEIQENHAIYTMYDDRRIAVKYVDSCYDSRDNTIWSITLRDMTNTSEKSKTFAHKSCKSEVILKWLRNK